MITAHGYAIQEPGAPLAPWTFQRSEPGPDDVQIEILYTGICHTDLHQATDHWNGQHPNDMFLWAAGVQFPKPSPPKINFGFRANDGTQIDAGELPTAIDQVESILERFASLAGP
jgi:hypothetical protein